MGFYYGVSFLDCTARFLNLKTTDANPVSVMINYVYLSVSIELAQVMDFRIRIINVMKRKK